MMVKTNAAVSLSHRERGRSSDEAARRRGRAHPPAALRPAESAAQAGEVILDLALCLILAATIIGLLVQAL